MLNKSDLIEVQVFLRNDEKNILRKFRNISDPKKRQYRKFQPLTVISPKLGDRAKQFFDSWENTCYTESDFPDVFTIWTTREELQKQKKPYFIETIEHEPNFEEVLYIWTSRLKEKRVEILPRLPSIGRTLKKRLNMECMLEGLAGKTLLAPIDSIAAEFPAVTVFTDQSRPKFSKDFQRRVYADYQQDFVNIYLWDPEGKAALRKIAFEKGGRASPDIFLKNPEEFVSTLEQLPPLGFLGYLFYQNAALFKKVEMEACVFPGSDSLWNANSGLGAPKLNILKALLHSNQS